MRESLQNSGEVLDLDCDDAEVGSSRAMNRLSKTPLQQANTAPPRPIPEEPLLGIALIIGSGAPFSISDTISKYLSASMPVVEIAWLRYATFLLTGCEFQAPQKCLRLTSVYAINFMP
jgi:hypothetical protein